jgi:hypothetical protein
MDAFTTQNLQQRGIEDLRKGIKYKIADRGRCEKLNALWTTPQFLRQGTYLLMLYISYFMHELQDAGVSSAYFYYCLIM